MLMAITYQTESASNAQSTAQNAPVPQSAQLPLPATSSPSNATNPPENLKSATGHVELAAAINLVSLVPRAAASKVPSVSPKRESI